MAPPPPCHHPAWICPLCKFINVSVLGEACVGPNCSTVSSQTRTASTVAMNAGRRVNLNVQRAMFDSITATITTWFRSRMTRQQCQQYFADKEVGAFLIRKSRFSSANIRMPTLDWFTLVIKTSSAPAALLHNILIGYDTTSKLFTIQGAQQGQDDLIFENLQSLLLNFMIDPEVGRRSPVALVLPGQSAGGSVLL